MESVATAERSTWVSELYEANSAAVISHCRRFLKNSDDAADAAHEVFLRAMSSLHAEPASRQARAWLITVAQNYCVDLARRRRRMEAALSTLATEADRRTASEAEIINRQVLQGVMARLTERERLALWQSAVERRPLSEIASRLGLSYAAAAQVVSRARKQASRAAAGLATIAGLAGLRFIRRKIVSASIAPVVAGVALLPLAVAVTVATATSTHPGAGRFHTTMVHAGQATHPQISPALATPGPSTLPASHRRIGRLLPGPVRDTFDSTLGNTVRTVKQLTATVPVPSALPTSAPVLPSASAPPLPVPTHMP